MRGAAAKKVTIAALACLGAASLGCHGESRQAGAGAATAKPALTPGAAMTARPVTAGKLTPLDPTGPAPLFSAVGDDGKTYSLASYRGKFVILYFYPKDDTPGCTTEAEGFRDDSAKFAARGAVVLGVSLQDAASHKAFREKYHLDFPLLTGGAALANAYRVPISGGMAARETFVIGPDGKIVKYFPNVDPAGHADAILALLK